MPATSAGMTAEGDGLYFVMAGLVPAIHVFFVNAPQVVDARDIGVRKHAVLRTTIRGESGVFCEMDELNHLV